MLRLRSQSVERIVSGVGVLDKAMDVLAALERSPLTLAELTAETGLSKPTVHRLAVALGAHGMVRRDRHGRYGLGLRLARLGWASAEAFPWWDGAWPALVELRDETGESVQLFVREGDHRLCVESLESPHNLRWIVPVGAVLPLDRGSAGRVLSGVDPAPPPTRPPGTRRSSPYAAESVPNRWRTWVESVEERERGVASVSAPVLDEDDRVIAALSVSGPLERLGRSPGARFGDAVVAAAREVERAAGLRP
jgi:DNA-binding IclR family transcriptional regulator